MIVKFHHRKHPYAMIDKRGLCDQRLSYKARGILACCMTMPAHLRVSMAFLIEQSPDGRFSVQSAFRELAKYGYAKLEQLRHKDGKIFGTQWMLYEYPELDTERSETGL